MYHKSYKNSSGSGFRVQGLGFVACGLASGVCGLGFGVQRLGSVVWRLWIGVCRLGFGVWGFGATTRRAQRLGGTGGATPSQPAPTPPWRHAAMPAMLRVPIYIYVHIYIYIYI